MTCNKKPNRILSLQDIGYYYFRNKGRFRREKIWVLKNINFDVNYGETLGIIGKNGVGKTTLLKLIAGITAPDKGRIIDKGYKSILLSLQAGFIPHLSGTENAYLNGMILGMGKSEIREKMDSIRSFSGLGNYFDEPINSYSTGMKARLGFSIALQTDPDILLVDEALGVGDSEFRKKSTAKMKEKILSNKTVILVSHMPNLIRELCDRVIWIEDGITKAIGKPDDVLAAYHKYLQNITRSEGTII